MERLVVLSRIDESSVHKVKVFSIQQCCRKMFEKEKRFGAARRIGCSGPSHSVRPAISDLSAMDYDVDATELLETYGKSKACGLRMKC